MPLVASGLVQQDEIRERVTRLRERFANDPDIAGIDHRIAEDWSGDHSLFIDVVLRGKSPSATAVKRLTEQMGTALLEIVRSEELGMHSYVNFSSGREHGQ